MRRYRGGRRPKAEPRNKLFLRIGIVTLACFFGCRAMPPWLE